MVGEPDQAAGDGMHQLLLPDLHLLPIVPVLVHGRLVDQRPADHIIGCYSLSSHLGRAFRSAFSRSTSSFLNDREILGEIEPAAQNGGLAADLVMKRICSALACSLRAATYHFKQMRNKLANSLDAIAEISKI